MRRVLLAMAVAPALVAFGALGVPAQAQHVGPALPPGVVYGVGCYWFRGRHYCSRYCWLEIDGYSYCQRNLAEAGSQAPPPLVVVPAPHGYVPPRVRYPAPRKEPPPDHRKAPKP
jgi:hypothetical protein